MKYLLDRAKERSTWMGLVAIATGLGLGLEPAQAEAIISIGVALAGVIAAFTKD